ncbi:hypothetical protein THMIRHAS_21540 [Thiosulfatimonas sediminis]|uniref:Uncharacterized protein n=1 Tax=Thiosulfatimonas sediminis TaxID=2675054 RepID=A0A6F8PXC8_9GAMM|nr:hypothetical protein [Thiosulfatimonas sediminis]BBP46781.1 hypothetical protein THMIRHAS_21540 [Thiosulfatimonas sediminis]
MTALNLNQPLVQFSQHSPLDLRQRHLAKHCFWEEYDQLLIVDARQIIPSLGVFALPSWDKMMLDAEMIGDYPSFLKPFDWPKVPALQAWLKQIPQWVQDSCKLFPQQQLKLLHYCAKYPQIFELLDHSPMLAWRLVSSDLQEPEIVALLSGKRQELVGQLGWPGKAETVKLLRNLRLRFVNQQIAEQIEVCILDPKRLDGLQALPRINSMALSLAAGFPELIGSRLHQSLAQLPCRPMQCQSMIALLADVLQLSELLTHSGWIAQVAQCRYLSEVDAIYQQALQSSLPIDLTLNVDFLHSVATPLENDAQRQQLSLAVQHPWHLIAATLTPEQRIVAWQEIDEHGEKQVWSALVALPQAADDATPQVLKIRGKENQLAQAKQLSDLHLWLLQTSKAE